MCGICGIISSGDNLPVDRSRLDRMVDQIQHRGPDATGTWTDNEVGLGHARLAVIDLSENAAQPMSNETGSLHLTYNGEIYNFKELRAELETKGHRFISRSDTEVILHLYEEEGTKCINRLRGMFAFAIWDDDKKQLLLARDRMGQKPLYYYQDDKRFLFASEIKALLATDLIKIEPDYQAIHLYLAHGYVPCPYTGFKNIRKLPPGHQLVLTKKDSTITPYWSETPTPLKAETGDDNEYAERLLELLTEATCMRTVSDVPLGVLLSGGIDSSAIAAILARAKGKVQTFTVGFDDKLYDERKEAADLARMLGTDHHEMIVKPDVADILPRLVRAYDEPFADPSALPSYYVAQMARQHVTVVLNGDGADENFAGYGTYIQGTAGAWAENLPKKLGRVLARIIDQPTPGKRQSLAQVLSLSGQDRARIFASLKLTTTLSDIAPLLNTDFTAAVIDTDPVEHLANLFDRADPKDMINAMLWTDRRTFLPDDLLFKIDIASMSHGLEARSPFLDHHLVEFAAGLPGHWKLKGTRKKHILKLALKDLLPTDVLKRPKRGFDVPVSRWLRNELHDMSHELLLNGSLVRNILKSDTIEAQLAGHSSGRHDSGRLIWTLLMLELWWREFFGD